MKQQSPGPRDEGFMVVSLMLGITALSLAAAYVSSQTQLFDQGAKSQSIERARSITELSNISALGRARALLRAKKTGLAYEAALYPENYFAWPWKLVKNKDLDLSTVTSENNMIRLMGLQKDSLPIAKAASVFTASAAQLSLLTDAQTVEIVDRRALDDHPYAIEYVDVSTTRIVDVEKGSGARDVQTLGRIKLDPPLPTAGKILVKFPGSSDFVDHWDENAPHPSGTYAFRVLASGVVHHALVSIGGNQAVTVGLDPVTNEPDHDATNIKAKDEIIGEFTITLGVKASYEDAVISWEKCVLNPEASPSGEAGGSMTIKTMIIGVMGETTKPNPIAGEAPLSIVDDRKISFASSGGSESESPTGIGCQESCPMNWQSVWQNAPLQAQYLDLSLTGTGDPKLLDYFEPEISTLITGRAKGIICGNMDLVAQAMKEQAGVSAVNLLSTGFEAYRGLRDRNMALKRYVAYTVPSCKRQLVALRNECGCFADDTLIQMGDGSTRFIRDIRQGDSVWNPKLGVARYVKRVIAGPEKIPMYRISTAEKTVLVTKQHPFLLSRGLTAAAQLKAGDVILGGDSDKSAILSIDLVPWSGEDEAPVVWNIELEGTSDFGDHYVLANGIMTGDLFIQETLGKLK